MKTEIEVVEDGVLLTTLVADVLPRQGEQITLMYSDVGARLAEDKLVVKNPPKKGVFEVVRVSFVGVITHPGQDVDARQPMLGQTKIPRPASGFTRTILHVCAVNT